MFAAADQPCTAFEGHRLLVSGPLVDIALALMNAAESGVREPILIFDNATGRLIDLDLRGTADDVMARLSPLAPSEETATEARGRGRPKLGVIGREVTLLPRHWDWLASQPGGASVALRKLVDEARKHGAAAQALREAQERAYRFMSALAGDLPGFEEASRALFANNREGFEERIGAWPEDVAAFAMRLAFGD